MERSRQPGGEDGELAWGPVDCPEASRWAPGDGQPRLDCNPECQLHYAFRKLWFTFEIKLALNYFRARINNAAVEGMNNKAKVVMRRAYGLRTADSCATNLYHCLADLPMPETPHRFA